MEYTVFEEQPCRKCQVPTLVGIVHGLFFRLENKSIDEATAKILAHYGFTPVAVSKCGEGDIVHRRMTLKDSKAYPMHHCHSEFSQVAKGVVHVTI